MALGRSSERCAEAEGVHDSTRQIVDADALLGTHVKIRSRRHPSLVDALLPPHLPSRWQVFPSLVARLPFPLGLARPQAEHADEQEPEAKNARVESLRLLRRAAGENGAFPETVLDGTEPLADGHMAVPAKMTSESASTAEATAAVQAAAAVNFVMGLKKLRGHGPDGMYVSMREAITALVRHSFESVCEVASPAHVVQLGSETQRELSNEPATTPRSKRFQRGLDQLRQWVHGGSGPHRPTQYPLLPQAQSIPPPRPFHAVAKRKPMSTIFAEAKAAQRLHPPMSQRPVPPQPLSKRPVPESQRTRPPSRQASEQRPFGPQSERGAQTRRHPVSARFATPAGLQTARQIVRSGSMGAAHHRERDGRTSPTCAPASSGRPRVDV